MDVSSSENSQTQREPLTFNKKRKSNSIDKQEFYDKQLSSNYGKKLKRRATPNREQAFKDGIIKHPSDSSPKNVRVPLKRQVPR